MVFKVICNVFVGGGFGSDENIVEVVYWNFFICFIDGDVFNFIMCEQSCSFDSVFLDCPCGFATCID